MSSLKFLFLIISLLILTINLCQTRCEEIDRGGNDHQDDEDEPLQEGRTRRMIWLDKKRRLVFPPDTSLSVTPMLAFPMFKQSSTWVSFENLQIQWTFFILFTGLGWTSDDNAWPLDLSLLFPNMTSSANESGGKRRRNEQLGTCNHPYNKNKYNLLHLNCKGSNSIPIMALPVNQPGGERATLLPRMEAFLNSFGINGRACLQRAVCEIHEIPLKYGFGLLGELLTMFFSISESTYARSHLQGYLKAEKAGRFGDCSLYHRKCRYSIFTSK